MPGVFPHDRSNNLHGSFDIRVYSISEVPTIRKKISPLMSMQLLAGKHATSRSLTENLSDNLLAT